MIRSKLQPEESVHFSVDQNNAAVPKTPAETRASRRKRKTWNTTVTKYSMKSEISESIMVRPMDHSRSQTRAQETRSTQIWERTRISTTRWLVKERTSNTKAKTRIQRRSKIHQRCSELRRINNPVSQIWQLWRTMSDKQSWRWTWNRKQWVSKACWTRTINQTT